MRKHAPRGVSDCDSYTRSFSSSWLWLLAVAVGEVWDRVGLEGAVGPEGFEDEETEGVSGRLWRAGAGARVWVVQEECGWEGAFPLEGEVVCDFALVVIGADAKVWLRRIEVVFSKRPPTCFGAVAAVSPSPFRLLSVSDRPSFRPISSRPTRSPGF